MKRRNTREAKQQTYTRYIELDVAILALRIVLKRRLLLRETAEYVGCTLRLLKVVLVLRHTSTFRAQRAGKIWVRQRSE